MEEAKLAISRRRRGKDNARNKREVGICLVKLTLFPERVVIVRFDRTNVFVQRKSASFSQLFWSHVSPERHEAVKEFQASWGP